MKHKHKFFLLASNPVHYYFSCRECPGTAVVHKAILIRLLTRPVRP